MTYTEADRRELRRIVSLALDGPLDDAQGERLVELLASPEARAEYAALAANDAILELHSARTHLSLSGERDWQTAPIVATAASVVQQPAPARREPLRKRVAVSHSRLWALRSGWVAALAASLALALMVSHRRSSLATIVAAEGATLADGSTVEVGARLGSRWLKLDTGSVRISFGQGAQVALRAPAKFRASDANAGELEYGVLNSHVPASAIGYTVSTPRMVVQDLSTGFALSAAKEGTVESLLVTEGKVSASARGSADSAAANRRQSAPPPMVLSAGDVLVARDGSAGVELQKRSPQQLRPRTSRNIKFMPAHPASLDYNMFDHSGTAYVFLESVSRPLVEELPLNLRTAGRWTKFGEAGVLPAGSVVDCYLVHYAPEGIERQQLAGTIRFPGKILGVITSSDRLNATNHLLGAEWTLQCFHGQRGVEQPPNINADVVTLSPDGHTLSVIFRAEDAIDQLRVLVEPFSSPK